MFADIEVKFKKVIMTAKILQNKSLNRWKKVSYEFILSHLKSEQQLSVYSGLNILLL